MLIATKGFAEPGDGDSKGKEKGEVRRRNGSDSYKKLATWVKRNSDDILDFLAPHLSELALT